MYDPSAGIEGEYVVFCHYFIVFKAVEAFPCCGVHGEGDICWLLKREKERKKEKERKRETKYIT